LPGHSEAAIAAYPEFGNSDIKHDWKPEVATQFGALPYTLSPKKQSLQFAKDILSELSVLFPNSSFVHIGGDEVSTRQWSQSQSALQVEKEQHLSEHRLEGMMIEGAAGHVRGLHRRPIVWDEAMQSGAKLPEGTVVMLWRSWEGIDRLGDQAHEMNLPVVLAPQDHTYLDQWQSPNGQGEKYDAIGGYLPLSKVYETQVHAGSARVLGIQGQLWSEYIREGGKNLDYMAWPRGCALAEAAWAGDHRPGFADFQQRLQKRTADFKQLHVDYRAFQM
jgi:hexosaminidase